MGTSKLQIIIRYKHVIIGGNSYASFENSLEKLFAILRIILCKTDGYGHKSDLWSSLLFSGMMAKFTYILLADKQTTFSSSFLRLLVFVYFFRLHKGLVYVCVHLWCVDAKKVWW